MTDRATTVALGMAGLRARLLNNKGGSDLTLNRNECKVLLDFIEALPALKAAMESCAELIAVMYGTIRTEAGGPDARIIQLKVAQVLGVLGEVDPGETLHNTIVRLIKRGNSRPSDD